MATTYEDMVARDIPFYDQADPGQYCGAPCWPYDEVNSPGDAPDCEGQVVILGIVEPDGTFRSEDAPAFKPSKITYVCPGCRAQGRTS